MKTLLTPQMIADRSLAHFTENLEFLKNMPKRHWDFELTSDTRTKWQKFKGRVSSNVNSWRHSLACWITPYGFDD